MSGMRLHNDVVIASAEHLLKHPIREELRPDVVVKLGGAPTTASVNQWLEAVQPRHVVLVDGEHRWHDASFTTTEHHAVDADWWVQVSRPAEARGRSEWLDRWQALDTVATAVVDEHLIDGRRSSGRAVRELCAGLPEWGIVMASNSMPPAISTPSCPPEPASASPAIARRRHRRHHVDRPRSRNSGR